MKADHTTPTRGGQPQPLAALLGDILPRHNAATAAETSELQRREHAQHGAAGQTRPDCPLCAKERALEQRDTGDAT